MENKIKERELEYLRLRYTKGFIHLLDKLGEKLFPENNTIRNYRYQYRVMIEKAIKELAEKHNLKWGDW